MKNSKQELKNVIIFICIILAFSIIYILIDKIINSENEESLYLKNYEVNEYIPTYVSDEDMARIYLNDYINTMYSDVDKAYELLDKEYRDKKFGNIDNYKNYIKTLNNLSYKVDSFYLDNSHKYKVYGVYDTNGNMFIFKSVGVMQYTVYLDDYTVEI